jgi:putative DNA primase/helicase
MRRGWKADGRKTSRFHLADCFTRSAPQGRIRTVPRTGWTDDGQAFVLPSATLGNGTEKYLLSPRPAKDIFVQGGSFAEWSKTIGRRAVGNHLLFFAISAALAAPLIHLLGQESGGVHFCGDTGSGKSTCLEAGCSVWGRPDVFGLTWRGTDNGLEGQAALHSDCLLALDEIGQAPERMIKEAAYLLGNEKGKARARADGTGRAPAQWRVITLSTGEISFSDALKQAGANIRGGQAGRLIDLSADAGAGLGAFQCLHGFDGPASLSEAIKKTAKENHGWAGPEFVRRLLAMPDRDRKLMAIFSKMRQSLTPDQAAPEVARAVKRFALIATAGALASRWGFFDGLAQDDGESIMAVQHCLKAWLSSRGGAGSLTEVQALERLYDFIGKHGARFQDKNAGTDDRPLLNRAGFRENLSTGETVYYIFPDNFNNEICAGLHPVQAARTLADMGILKRGELNHLKRKERLPDLGLQRVYVVGLPGGGGLGE